LESYIIEGGKRLEGEVDISGSKNATLPIMAACVLNKGINTLYNVPNIYDVYIMENILEYLGCKIYRNNDKIVIDSSNISKYSIPEFLMRKMRSSVMLVGAIIGRMDKCIFSYPGGCEIGARPIDLHINAFRKLDIQVKEEGGYRFNISQKGEYFVIGNEVNIDEKQSKHNQKTQWFICWH
jgi:UDP-N-acetylglucosamine 1-carboxyvinyltransferase